MSEPVEYYSLGTQAVEERALFGEVSRDLGERWRVTGDGRWFGYGIAMGTTSPSSRTRRCTTRSSATTSPTTAASCSRAASATGLTTRRTSTSRVRRDTASAAATTSGSARTRSWALLTDADPAANDPPQSGCIYADQALIRPDTITRYEVALRHSWDNERVTFSGTLFHVDWTDIQVAGLTPFSAEPITLMAVEPSVWLKGATPGGALPAGATAVCRYACSGSNVVPPACSSVVRIRADSGRRGGYADGGTARVGRQRRGVARTRRTWCRFPRRGPSDRWCCAISSVARAWIFVQGHRLVFYICTSFPGAGEEGRTAPFVVVGSSPGC